jgi:hypothetical protein
MLARFALKKTIGQVFCARSFVALWPPVKGSKVVNSVENVSLNYVTL